MKKVNKFIVVLGIILLFIPLITIIRMSFPPFVVEKLSELPRYLYILITSSFRIIGLLLIFSQFFRYKRNTKQVCIILIYTIVICYLCGVSAQYFKPINLFPDMSFETLVDFLIGILYYISFFGIYALSLLIGIQVFTTKD